MCILSSYFGTMEYLLLWKHTAKMSKLFWKQFVCKNFIWMATLMIMILSIHALLKHVYGHILPIDSYYSLSSLSLNSFWFSSAIFQCCIWLLEAFKDAELSSLSILKTNFASSHKPLKFHYLLLNPKSFPLAMCNYT